MADSETIKQTCRSSLICCVTTVPMACLTDFFLANNRHVCVEHRTTLVESKDELNMLSCVSMEFLYGFQTISRYVTSFSTNPQ